MERLTYKITNIQNGNVLSYGLNSGCNMMLKGIQKLGAYEDAEEQGLLLRLPCKIGTTVYAIYGNKVTKGALIRQSSISFLDDFGKTVFLTKEEAEQALKQMGE